MLSPRASLVPGGRATKIRVAVREGQASHRSARPFVETDPKLFLQEPEINFVSAPTVEGQQRHRGRGLSRFAEAPSGGPPGK
jgi:hypothetical protein